MRLAHASTHNMFTRAHVASINCVYIFPIESCLWRMRNIDVCLVCTFVYARWPFYYYYYYFFFNTENDFQNVYAWKLWRTYIYRTYVMCLVSSTQNTIKLLDSDIKFYTFITYTYLQSLSHRIEKHTLTIIIFILSMWITKWRERDSERNLNKLSSLTKRNTQHFCCNWWLFIVCCN